MCVGARRCQQESMRAVDVADDDERAGLEGLEAQPGKVHKTKLEQPL